MIKATDPIVAAGVTCLTADDQENWDERAAIMEYQGNLSRRDAEEWALVDVIKNRISRDPEEDVQ